MTAQTSDPVARRMVSRGNGGDLRNPEPIQAWAHHIAAHRIATDLGATGEPGR
ncbi:hypothetical protein [Streptomyces sp. NPDC046332]|uniref:hypothetical protein n=1 Tax=Streptomyces sp. NPDC046332 TaxID=3155133 RepID=UPI003407A961